MEKLSHSRVEGIKKKVKLSEFSNQDRFRAACSTPDSLSEVRSRRSEREREGEIKEWNLP